MEFGQSLSQRVALTAPFTQGSLGSLEFWGRLYAGVTIPGAAERSESCNNMLAGGKHTYTNQGKAVTIS